MQEFIEIHGGVPLSGTINISGAKNAALPMLIASLLTSEECIFENVPNLLDVHITLKLLQQFGAEVEYDGYRAKVKTPRLLASEASYSLVKALRASFWVLAPLLARGGAARVALPGGDSIGTRGVDMHLKGLEQMGAEVQLKHGTVYARAPKGLRPVEIDLSTPSVGATHQLLMAAALTRGVSTIKGAACEPEVVALARMLTEMGAKIKGAGTSCISIEGTDMLQGASSVLIGDRIEAGTYLCAVLATGGELKLDGINPEHLGSFLDILPKLGGDIEKLDNSLQFSCSGAMPSLHVETGPFPGFATDLQPLLVAALCNARGESRVVENIFDGRFQYTSELNRMGAQIEILNAREALIVGGNPLTGAEVEAADIRGGASLVIAGLAAQGVTRIYEIDHIRRGYSSLESKLTGVGARVSSKIANYDDFAFIGC